MKSEKTDKKKKGEGIYMFEDISDRRMNGDQQEVLIKWKGYKKTTWEPAENLVKR